MMAFDRHRKENSMFDLPTLFAQRMRALQPHFPNIRGLKRVNGRRVLSSIICVIRQALQWKDALSGWPPPEAPSLLWSLSAIRPARLAESVSF